MSSDHISSLQCSEESLKKFDLKVKDKKELINLINESIYKRCAKSPKDKFEVLDLRDKVLKLIRYEMDQSIQNEGASVITLTGTCMDMCPEKERFSREYLSLLHKYEMGSFESDTDYSENPPDSANHRLMIKEYSRSSADQDLPLPNEMRPLSILFDTMLFLIDEIIPRIARIDNIDSGDFSICDWYDFIWNRTRSIRKDIIQQRLLFNQSKDDQETNDQIRVGGVIIIEQCARFHIMCAYRLCDQSDQVFDFKINEENLKNCFQSLRQYYEITSIKPGDNTTKETALRSSPNESEFRSYIILLNLNQSNILREIQRWSEQIRSSKHVRFALNIYFAYNSRNYIKFFRLVRSNDCEYLQACILHRYFFKVRCEAFKTIFSAFREGNKERSYPLLKLVECLGFDDSEEVYSYCNAFGLDIIDDTNVIMRPNINFGCFNLPKSSVDQLKSRKSRSLVESKFLSRIKGFTSNETCVSEIINGVKLTDGQTYTKKSRFCMQNYRVHTSFSEDGFFISDEINQLLSLTSKSNIHASNSNQKSGNNKSVIIKSHLNSIKHNNNNNALFKRANTIVKRAHQEVLKQTQLTSSDLTLNGTKERRKSSSSTSSSTSSTSGEHKLKNKKKSDVKISSETSENENKTFKPFGTNSFQPAGVFGSSTLNLEANPFSSFVNKAKTDQKNTLPQSFGSQVAVPIEPQPRNLFESLVQAQQQQHRPPVPQPVANHQLEIEKQRQRILYQKSESFFQSFLYESVKDIASNIVFSHNQVAQEICSEIIVSTVQNELYRVVQNELIEKSRNETKAMQLASLSEKIYESLLTSVIAEFCSNFIQTSRQSESIIYEDILMSVFQREFDLILKQIAGEINNDLVLDRLAESVYFTQPESQVALPESNFYTDDDKLCSASMFMNDLRSYLHECIYEFTRLNLNVNRELYYELKQALIINQQLYLFRKWRLKLSVKLLRNVQKQSQQSIKHQDNQQLALVSFMNSYGTYLRENLSKFQKLHSILISNCNNYTIVHCEQYLMHLTWNHRLKYKYILYDILFDNYFNIIHNRDDMILLPPPTPNPSPNNSPLSVQSPGSTLRLQRFNNEIYVKTIVAMPSVTDDVDIEALKRWLMNKMFYFDSKTYKYNTKISENLSIDLFDPNKYGIKFYMSLCSTTMNESNYESKLEKRSLFGSNSIIYVLMPVNTITNEYIFENRTRFLNILNLFNENMNGNRIDRYEFMFVSYLSDEEQTKRVIELILNEKYAINYCFCLLDGDVIKDNAILQRTLEVFTQKVCRKNLDFMRKYEHITNFSNISKMYDMSLMKFWEFLTVHSVRKNIYLNFNSIVKEYNSRLSKFIEMITNNEYLQVSWPIPELIDTNSWTLKYWNTTECFNEVLKKQFHKLMILNEDNSADDSEEIDFDQIERQIFNYLNRVLNDKKSQNILPQESECIKSIYQLECSIKIALERMKNSNGSKIARTDFEWVQVLLPIVDYLLTNGYLMFKNRKINLDEFYICYNIRELKEYDWINNCEVSIQLSASPNLNYLSSIMQNYALVKSYLKKATKQNNLKRRYSENANNTKSGETKGGTEDLNSSRTLSSSMLQNVNPNKQLRLQFDAIKSPVSSAAETEFDSKLQKFINSLNKERENNLRFEERLNLLVQDSSVTEKISDQLNDESKHEENSTDLTKNFDDFFEKLKEEKLKGQELNNKLNKMLNF